MGCFWYSSESRSRSREKLLLSSCIWHRFLRAGGGAALCRGAPGRGGWGGSGSLTVTVTVTGWQSSVALRLSTYLNIR